MLTAFVVPGACYALLCPKWSAMRIGALLMAALAIPLTLQLGLPIAVHARPLPLSTRWAQAPGRAVAARPVA